jgi:septal ring factor EnvC (AmiA/AmiB activator)
MRFFIGLFLLSTIGLSAMAQPASSKEQLELEKQRQILKKELEQTQQQLELNKKSTKESLSQLQLYNRKINLQGNVVETINRDINLLDNNIYRSQRDINKLHLLLDTLKQEYSKSMVYAYKNRSNSDFLNFIFSSSSFNDAIKRITYLKSYRNYREMQGDNILRTQDLLRSRIDELSGNKQKKNTVLETQSKELTELQKQQEEKNKLVLKLKAQSKELNGQIAAKKKQMQKVNSAIAAAIKRAQDEAIKEATARAASEKAKRDEEARKLAIEKNKNQGNTNTDSKSITARPAKPTTSVKRESVLLASDADVKLNASFESNRGSLPWPVDRGLVIQEYGVHKFADLNVVVDNPGITLQADIGTPVKAVFEGEVSSVSNIENMQVVILKHGRYFSTYSNLTGVNISRGQAIRTGQVLGRVAANDEGLGSIDVIISNEKGNMNPESWLRRR